MLNKIKRKLNKIEDEKLYSPNEILKMGVIIDTSGKPSVFSIYRLIKRGLIETVNVSTGNLPRYLIKGKNLKNFIKTRYNL